MNRIDRISAILIQLQSARVVKAQHIAGRFNISLRTVYRDIKTLEEAGVPIIGEAGVGYSLVDGYRLPPVMFTREEAVAFVTAEKLVEKLTDSVNGSSYSSAMFKIKSVLRTVDKDFLEHIDSRIEVLKARRGPQIAEHVNPLQNILQGIAHKKVVHLKYNSAYQETCSERDVEPVGVFYLDGYWHLIAYCRLRNDYRDFRFDRISDLILTDQYFQDNHLPLQHFLERLYKHRDLQKVVIRVKKETLKFLGEQKYYHGFVKEENLGDQVDLHFLTVSLKGFARWLMMFADYATVIEPDSLRIEVRDISENILKNFSSSFSC